MNKRYYNEEDKKYAELIKTLRDLPQLPAPDNFEMNLRRRLNNLDASSKRRPALFPFNLRLALIPAAGLVAVVIALFFTMPYMNRQIPESKPALTESSTGKSPAELPAPSEAKQGEIQVADKAGQNSIEQPSKANPPASIQRTPAEAQPRGEYASSEELKQMLRDFNLSGYGNDVDKSLRAKPDRNIGAYGSESQNVGFNNFNTVAPENDRVLEEMKARVDTIKKKMRGNR